MITVGDKVTWKSQSRGKWTEKTGTVVAVVKPGEEAYRAQIPWHEYSATGPFIGAARVQISYLVAVNTPAKRGRKAKIYWPRLNTLKKA